jgi:serine/threonine protein kinase
LGLEALPAAQCKQVLRALLEKAGVGISPSHILLHADGSLDVTAGEPEPGYRAPESSSGPDATADVYVIGTLYYELRTGRRLGQLPEREMLHGPALDRALDDLPDLSMDDRMLLKAMLAFRPASRAQPRLLLSELGEPVAPLPGAVPPRPAASSNLRWFALIGCVLVLSVTCAFGAVLLLWMTRAGEGG